MCFLSEIHNRGARDIRVSEDDSALFFRVPASSLSTSMLAVTLFEALNVRLSTEKSEVSLDPSDMKILRCRYLKCAREKPELEWLKAALYPERAPPTTGESFGRLVGLSIAGGRNNKRFCDFFDYYQSGRNVPAMGPYPSEIRRYHRKDLSNELPLFWTAADQRFICLQPMRCWCK